MTLTDALGNLIDFRLLPGQAHDLRGTAVRKAGVRLVPCRPVVRRQLAARRPDPEGDRASHPAQIQPPLSGGIRPHRLQMATPDRALFGKLKEYIGIATRACKTDESG